MKHAGCSALDRLEPLPAGLFADVRLKDDFERRKATTAKQQQELLRRIDRRLQS